MKTIRIIGTPDGKAPDEVREEWIGLILPLAPEKKNGECSGPLNGQPENLGGYEVDLQVALGRLEQKSPKAAEWYREAPYQLCYERFVFAKEVCELVHA